jgi:hypothetical protein
MYSSHQTCNPSFESSVPRLFEHQYNYRVGIEPVIHPLRDVDDIRDQEERKDLIDVDDIRNAEEVITIIKNKTIKKVNAIKQLPNKNNNKYYGCIEELLRTNITHITKKNKHKKPKINKIFAALCESSDDDEYSHNTTFSEDNFSKNINYESKSVNVYDPSSVVEHKEDSDI